MLGVANGLGEHWRALASTAFDYFHLRAASILKETLVECLLNIMVIQTRKRHFEKYIFVHGIGFRKL